MVSGIEFAKTGKHLATRDRGGRVVLFDRVDFDYLKSLEIEVKINMIRWCQTANSAIFLLSTNDKTIKFWKSKKRRSSNFNVEPSRPMSDGFISSLNVPTSFKACYANGGCIDNCLSCRSNNLSFLPGGITSLRLHM
ncbi:Protein phosphatase 2A, regulatory subunit PR55, partial [Cynara cardunculus var. scolymus]